MALRKSLIKSLKNLEPVLKGAVVSFYRPMRKSILGSLGSTGSNLVSRAPDPLVSIEGEDETSWRHRRHRFDRFPPGVVKVLVNFYRSGQDYAFDRQRSRVTFDLPKQSSVAAVKKHLTEFPGLMELALKFGMADFELKLFRLQRSSNGKTENYSIVTQQQWQMEIPFLLGDEGQSELNGKCQIFGLTHFIGNSATCVQMTSREA